MRRWLLASMLLLAPPAPGQGTQEERFLAWWESQLEASAQRTYMTKLPDLEITYRKTTYLNMTPSEAAELRRRLSEIPHHPKSDELARYDALVAEGPRSVTFRFRVWDRGVWRTSIDVSHQPGLWSEKAMRSDRAWSLAAGQLSIGDPSSEEGAGPRFAIIEHADMRSGLDGMLLGSLWLLDYWQADVEVAELLDRKQWVAEGEYAGNNRFKVRGDWNSELGRGFVRSISSDSEYGVLLENDPWIYDQTIGDWICKRWIHRFADGTLKTEFVITGVHELPAGSIDALTAVSGAGGNRSGSRDDPDRSSA